MIVMMRITIVTSSTGRNRSSARNPTAPAFSGSATARRLVCSTYFRRILIDAGEDPAALRLDADDELIVELGRALADDAHIPDELYGRLAARYSERQLVELTGFAAIMVATNVFNDMLGVPLDDYLQPYRKAA